MTVDAYDLVMLAVLLAATAFGAWKGVAWQVASLGAIFASYVVAYRYRDVVAAWIPVAAPWRVFLAMLVLYVGTSLAIWIGFRVVKRLINRMKLKEFDRQIGALLGLAKGVVLCVIITLFAITLLGDRQRQAIVNSRSGYYIAALLSRSRAVIPNEFRDVLRPYLEAFDRRLPDPSSADAEQGGGASQGPFSLPLRMIN